MERHYTAAQVASILGKSKKTIWRYAGNGTLKAIRDTHSQQLLFAESEVQRYQADHWADARDARYIDSRQILPAHQARGL